MIITVNNDGAAASIKEIELSKNEHFWTLHIYTEDLSPFGKVNVQGSYNPKFYMTFRTTESGSLPWTIITFSPENETEIEWLRDGTVIASRGKLWDPERKMKQGQYCRRLYLIKETSDEKKSLPVVYKKSE